MPITRDTHLPAPLPREVREAPVRGRNLVPGSFSAQLEGRTLLVFLRHLG